MKCSDLDGIKTTVKTLPSMLDELSRFQSSLVLIFMKVSSRLVAHPPIEDVVSLPPSSSWNGLLLWQPSLCYRGWTDSAVESGNVFLYFENILACLAVPAIKINSTRNFLLKTKIGVKISCLSIYFFYWILVEKLSALYFNIAWLFCYGQLAMPWETIITSHRYLLSGAFHRSLRNWSNGRNKGTTSLGLISILRTAGFWKLHTVSSIPWHYCSVYGAVSIFSHWNKIKC